MRKIILGLFVILFCFSIGTARLQEEELSKEEKVKAELDIKIERYLKLLNRSRLEKLSKEDLIIEILDLKEFIKLDQLAIKLLEELVEIHEEDLKDIRELIKEKSKPEEKDDLSWLKDIPDLTKKEEEFSWLDKWEEEDRLERIEEENDRLEDLLEEFRSERFSLEMDMIGYTGDMLMLRPDPFDYKMALDLAMSSMMMEIELGIYPYFPSYSRQTDWTNYEPLLFTLSTDSKGKMDWTKYGWLKLLLKKK